MLLPGDKAVNRPRTAAGSPSTTTCQSSNTARTRRHPGRPSKAAASGAEARGIMATQTSSRMRSYPAQDGDFASYLHTKAIPQMKELLNNYGDFPVVIWFDTPTADMTPALAGEIVTLLNQHPNLIWNNRLGGSYKGDTETPEQFIPAQGYPGRDWEACMTMNDTWGFKSYDTNFKSTEMLLRNLIDIASKGGNYLLNIGPASTGRVPPAEAERLQQVGQWLSVNGEAIDRKSTRL